MGALLVVETMSMMSYSMIHQAFLYYSIFQIMCSLTCLYIFFFQDTSTGLRRSTRRKLRKITPSRKEIWDNVISPSKLKRTRFSDVPGEDAHFQVVNVAQSENEVTPTQNLKKLKPKKLIFDFTKV